MVKKARKRHWLYLLGFLLALHTALPGYIHSTFIGEFSSEKLAGIVFTLSAILSIFLFIQMPRILSRFGEYLTSVVLIIATAVLVALFVVIDSAWILLPAMIVFLALLRLIWLNLDLMLERFSSDKDTGTIRGIYLTIVNLAWLVAPAAAGLILAGTNYERLYLVALVLLLITLPIFVLNFKHYRDPEYKHPPFWKTLKTVLKSGDINRIFMVSFLLRFFYSWMVIYTPIYLNQTIGFDWQAIGFIFTIMLLPFSLFDYPLGRLADSKLGEKELLLGGFVVMSIATIWLSFITTPSFLMWAFFLFMTRVGAATIDIMSDTYFFKKIDDTQSDLLGFFRMTDPIAYVVGPLIASLALVFVDERYLFLILGCIMFLGFKYLIPLNDTK